MVESTPATTAGCLAGHQAWRWGPERRWATWLVALAVVTFLIRAYYFGNATVDVDEEFYLLVGDRVLHGAIPYVDIWDRKPVGIFLLYAGVRLLGGDGVLQYQIVAAIFACATAVVIALIARRIAPPTAALVAGLTYAPALAMSGGQGDQSPVFYNLLVALAALVVLEATTLRPRRPESPAGSPDDHGGTGFTVTGPDGAVAMLLVGLAIQIKYTAVFEGAYLGVALLRAAAFTRARFALAADAALWISCAMLPTAAAWGWYAAHGHDAAFVYANFASVLNRGHVAHPLTNIRHVLVRLLPFAAAIVVYGLRRGDAPARRRRRHANPTPSSLAGSLWLRRGSSCSAAGSTIMRSRCCRRSPLPRPRRSRSGPGLSG